MSAKIKALSAQSLDTEQYELLSSKRNLFEVLSYLKAIPAYKDLFSEVSETTANREQLEAQLKKDQFIKYHKLFHYVSFYEKKVLSFVIMRSEVEELLRYVRYINSDTNETFFLKLDYLYRNSKIDFNSLTGRKSFTDLLNAVKDTIYYQPLIPFVDRYDYPGVEHALRATFYSHLLSLIKRNLSGPVQKQMLDATLMVVDFINISAIIRIKAFYTKSSSPSDIRPQLLPHAKHLKGQLLEDVLSARGKDEIYELLKKSKYHLYFTNLDRQYVDAILPSFYLHYFGRIAHTGTPTIALAISYLYMVDLENRNLTDLIEGVSYGLAPESIKKYLYF